MTTPTVGEGTPWYHHFWPWFIVILMTLSVGASLFTVAIAYRHRDVDVRTLTPADVPSTTPADAPRRPVPGASPGGSRAPEPGG